MLLSHYIIVSGLIFSIGFFGVLFRTNALVMLMSLELMLNAINLMFVAFSRFNLGMDGVLFVFFTITVAAAEVAVGLAIVVALFKRKATVNVSGFNQMKN